MNLQVLHIREEGGVSDTEPEKIIVVSNLKISFGTQQVLNNLSFHLNKGENLVILGKSGSGKSVAIKCITELLKPDSGSIEVMGHEVNKMNSDELAGLRKKIGFLFQSGALYDSMTVKDNLEFPLKRINRRIKENELNEKVKTVLENVGLAHALDKMPSELSGGMRKRIALARTLIVDPVIMLYDEPTTGLDPITSLEISVLINEIQKKYNTSSIIITHDMDCAREVADRVIILKDGEVLAEGSLKELEQSEDEWIRSFFGKI
ncbi:MAG: ATP-binding cassette domain-containing protein [Bacteroidetes bacterium]|nr:ATP-binding cassette domain-containing protein [Bacteroidota bacterium]